MINHPNILIVLADDHGQWATGCYGNQEVRTPNMDYLAETGVQFANAFTPCPVCSPARASLFTGHIPSQHGVHDFLSEDSVSSTHSWLEGEMFLSQFLQRQGYQTGLVGKWHCTTDGHRPQRGFDHWVSYDVRERGWLNQYQHRGEIGISYQGQPTAIQGFQSQYFTDESISFLKGRDRDRPFFLVASFVDTHFPFRGHPERLVEQYRHPERPHADIPGGEASYLPVGKQRVRTPEEIHERVAQYYAGVSMMDHQLGTLLDYLEGAEVLDNTVVVYTSDHGHMNGHHGLSGKGNATPLPNFFEESIRVPMLMRWPEGGLSHCKISAPFDHCDLFNTLLDAAQVELTEAEQQRIHGPGKSILPYLHSQDETWRTYQCCEYGNVRMITDLQNKLIRRYPPHAKTVSDEFFHLEIDPRETTNRVGDPHYQDEIEQLGHQLEAFYAQYEDPVHSGKRVLELPQHNQFELWRSQPD